MKKSIIALLFFTACAGNKTASNVDSTKVGPTESALAPSIAPESWPQPDDLSGKKPGKTHFDYMEEIIRVFEYKMATKDTNSRAVFGWIKGALDRADIEEMKSIFRKQEVFERIEDKDLKGFFKFSILLALIYKIKNDCLERDVWRSQMFLNFSEETRIIFWAVEYFLQTRFPEKYNCTDLQRQKKLAI